MALAVDPPADLYPPGTSVRIDATITNAGPDTSLSSTTQFDYFLFNGPGSQVLMGPIAETAPCEYAQIDVEPGENEAGGISILLYTPELAAGESVTCSLELIVIEEALGAFLLNATLAPFYIGGGGSIDPDRSDNYAEVLMQLTLPAPAPPAPVMIPATSLQVLAALALVVSAAALLALLRR